MRHLLDALTNNTPFMPHGGSYLWLPSLVTLHVLSDSIIALSYYSIPLTLLYLFRKERIIPYRWMFLMVGAFIVACGTTHLMEVFTVYVPIYWISGAIKAITAMLSVGAAIALFPIVPKALRLPSSVQWDGINRRLQSEEIKFRGLLEAAPEAMVIIDHEGKIVLLNAQAEKLFGYRRLELVGRELETLVPGSFRAHNPAPPSPQIADPRIRATEAEIELTARRKDGSQFPSEISFSPMETEDDLLATAVIRDMTERKRHEEEVDEVRRQAEEANRLKSEFLANMSHELRTPLNSVIGFSELIHDGKAGPVTANQKEYLDDVLGSARHLLQLINDILDLAKVEAGKIQFRPEPVELDALTKEVCGSLRPVADSKKIGLTVEIYSGLDTVEADPGRLKQVLYNYLSNALKFTPEGGKVRILATPAGEGYFQLAVQDTGMGIPPEDLGRLFVAFQQLDESASKKYQGTGLGLALTKKLIEAQGGRVGVDSSPGKGAIFYAVLPRKPL